MRTPFKEGLLEMLAGMIGWVWIIASCAGFYYLLMAVFSDGKWINVFLVFGIAAVVRIPVHSGH